MNLFKIEGETYSIDMNSAMDFITNFNSEDCNNNTEITQVYGMNSLNEDTDKEVEDYNSNGHTNTLELIQKQITENKNTGNDSLYNIRYDFLKLIFNTLINPLIDESGMAKQINSIHDMSFGQKLCLNTFLNNGIIKIN